MVFPGLFGGAVIRDSKGVTMRFAVSIMISLVVLLFPALVGAGVDNSLYAKVLEKYVSDGFEIGRAHV